jgi:hypothetical protein
MVQQWSYPMIADRRFSPERPRKPPERPREPWYIRVRPLSKQVSQTISLSILPTGAIMLFTGTHCAVLVDGQQHNISQKHITTT